MGVKQNNELPMALNGEEDVVGRVSGEQRKPRNPTLQRWAHDQGVIQECITIAMLVYFLSINRTLSPS